MLKGFKDFLLRGNVVDLAVAVVVGAAFTAIVTAFTTNVINPLVAALGGSNEYGFGFQITSSPESFVNVGAVITAVINFVIIAAVVYFVLILPVNTAKKRFVSQPEKELSDVDVLVQIRDILAGGTEAGQKLSTSADTTGGSGEAIDAAPDLGKHSKD
ncbi:MULTISPECIES: large conductance mechanosensitive channel protein MscL [unclassified Rhodococcus (in: high G+C Gram-positive bacteria)]|jgi:large conductance mechanosensitive channel|uniref:large conductance mechanosensitive channel protein MscL n=1 Tax=unclassified Rhodococcus (in: high G+C Gram-positive bacteria) TaxID=192944 RepID=UPI0005D99A06|nr:MULTISPECIES: large conductance mechanosensitive channel protein MscL [unclassified Rhodococcus (in: high G+C Gram-positive bacteria)]AJW40407.1 Large-conductance mechanosensitive channel [Rhodococcus sp. B7740]OZC67083.1 mechanosensitive ion channel protein MscL [Rhodococcus sp. 06-470-2]OZC72637.1 mechanosensitive ion channel protein MscL [Rhodococcus sp. 06-469-3-2]OZC76874.1 mechanosensitive ion channel protein MscL [Rhodococcus sp. 06-418-5]OZD48863.1 mechanosensitive ion channel prote